MEKGFIFNGESHKHQLLVEEIEDVGGIVLDKKIISFEATIPFVIPRDESKRIKNIVDSEIKGGLKEAPLLGTEIAVISPNIAKHHLPNILCDVAEYLRKFGAKTNMIGLARGAGQRTAQISAREKEIIEENDAAVFVVGNFEHCILNYKIDIFRQIKKTPYVVVGGPEELDTDEFEYVGGFGRLPYRLRTMHFIPLFNKIVDKLVNIMEEKRKLISFDPFYISPFILRKELEYRVEDINNIIAPMPIVCKIDGVRVKLPFHKYYKTFNEIKFGGKKLDSIANVKKSNISNHLLIKLKPMSGIAI
ncbi:MAG: methanogenesis marker 7 protein [Candidatus Lokiarchaeota archaeon]|nr:methanogenesis marker 7 protein [Candidatus Lokiarchaeota archaeon]